MAFYITDRRTTTQNSKGTSSTQSHSGETVKVTNSTPAGSRDVHVVDTDEISVADIQKGTVTDTKTTTGMGSTVTSNTSGTRENESVTVKFDIPIQQKNPVQLAQA